MTERSFKFKYANELVGGFVLLALIALVAGIFIAGRAQGWFERRAFLYTTFTTEKGAFGLREGDEVMIMDTVAGSVGKIIPKADGTMQTSFRIKHQFLSQLKKTATAKVQKKFGIAGDSIVVIEAGSGEMLEDGDFITCKKDEELMDTAKKTLANVQEVVMPIMTEMKGVLEHLNKITGNLEKSLESGSGLAGTLLKDEELAKEVKRMVGNMNVFMFNLRDAVGEAKKLIRGVQKHWLWKKYMDKDKGPELLIQAGLSSSELDADMKMFKTDLDLARMANDSEAIAMNSYNLAVCALEKRDMQAFTALVHESRAEIITLKKDAICTYVLEAQGLEKAGNISGAMQAAKTAEGMLNRGTDRGIELQCRVVIADLMRNKGDIAGAKTVLQKVAALERKIESPVIKSMAAGAMARLALSESNTFEAAVCFDKEADLLKAAGLFEKMAKSLESAGKAYGLSKNYSIAADRYFRSGRSLFCSGNRKTAEENLKIALEMGGKADDSVMTARILEFQSEMALTP